MKKFHKIVLSAKPTLIDRVGYKGVYVKTIVPTWWYAILIKSQLLIKQICYNGERDTI